MSQVVPGFESAKGVVFGVQDPAVRRRRRTQWLVYAGRIVLLFVVLSAWQYFGPRVGEIAASSPLHVYDSLRRLAASGILWRDPEAEAFQHELEGQPTELATGRDGLRAVQVVAAAVRRLETGCAASP